MLRFHIPVTGSQSICVNKFSSNKFVKLKNQSVINKERISKCLQVFGAHCRNSKLGFTPVYACQHCKLKFHYWYYSHSLPKQSQYENKHSILHIKLFCYEQVVKISQQEIKTAENQNIVLLYVNFWQRQNIQLYFENSLKVSTFNFPIQGKISREELE